MKRFLSKLFKILTIVQLRARYLRKAIDLENLSSTLGISVHCSLDLGSGPQPKNPFLAAKVYGVDIRSYDINTNVKKCIIGAEKIPFENEYFDAITSFDFLEHIPRASLSEAGVTFPLVETMNEIWRILKVDGLFYSETPCFPMKAAFQDPTHVNIMTEDTLKLYFAESAWSRIYGFRGSFRLVADCWRGEHYCCVLQKTSGTPMDNLNTMQK